MRDLRNLAMLCYNRALSEDLITPKEYDALAELATFIQSVRDHYWIETPTVDQLLNVHPDGTLRQR